MQYSAQHAGSASHRVLLFDAPWPQTIYTYDDSIQYMRVISLYEIQIHDMAQVQHNSFKRKYLENNLCAILMRRFHLNNT